MRRTRVMGPFQTMSPVEIGERLRAAREMAGFNQATAAEAANLVRTSLVAVEKGERLISVDEAQLLATFYGTTIDAIFRKEAVRVDFSPKFRRLPDSAEAPVADAIRRLTNFVRAEVELENLLGIRRGRSDPPYRPILPGDVRYYAEQDALDIRHWIGLGLAPVTDLISLLELQLGLRVFTYKLDPSIAGLLAYDDTIGACMLLNAEHRRERRAQTAAHQLGHLVATRDEPEILLENMPESREERYATSFGRAFLMPRRAIIQKFQELTAGGSHLTRRQVILLAHLFGVSHEAIVRRMEEIGVATSGTWDWFQNHGGITDQQAREVLGDAALPDDRPQAERAASARLGVMAAEAWRRELLSEGQLARLLQLDRVALRQLLDRFSEEQAEADGAAISGD